MSLNFNEYEPRYRFTSPLPVLPEQDTSSVLSDDASVTSLEEQDVKDLDRDHLRVRTSTPVPEDDDEDKYATLKATTKSNNSTTKGKNSVTSSDKAKSDNVGKKDMNKARSNSGSTAPKSPAISRTVTKTPESRTRPLSANLEHWTFGEARKKKVECPKRSLSRDDEADSPDSLSEVGQSAENRRLPSADSGLDDVTVGDSLLRSPRHGSTSTVDGLDSFRARDIAGSCRGFRTPQDGFRGRDVTGSLRIRDPTASLQPIRDSYLLQKLQGSNKTNLKLTPQDQRMLSRLLAKREEEQRMNEMRDLSHKQWERERELTKNMKQEQAKKQQSSHARERSKSDRLSVALESDTASVTTVEDDAVSLVAHVDWEDGLWQLDEEGQCRQDGDQRRMTIDVPLTRGEQQKQDFFDRLSRPRSSARFVREKTPVHVERTPVTQKSDTSNQPASDQMDKLHNGRSVLKPTPVMHYKSMKQLQMALDKKKSVEQSLEQQRQKTEKYMARIAQSELEEREALKQAANSVQDSKLTLAQIIQAVSSVRKSNLSLAPRLKFRGLHSKSTKDNHGSEMSAPSPAESEASHYIRRKAEKQRQAQIELQKKLEKSRQKQLDIEKELRDWQSQVIQYRKMQDKQAETLANAQIAQKRAVAAKEREEKEKIQRKNKLRMQAQEDEWKATVRASIISKDARSKMLQQEKDNAIKKSRELADITRRMREELKLNASINDLDQLSKHISLENRMKIQ